MKRLTEYTIPETGFSVVSEEKYKRILMEEKPSVEKVYNRLKKIEDILGEDYNLDRLRELVEADRENRCVIFEKGYGIVSTYDQDDEVFVVRTVSGVAPKSDPVVAHFIRRDDSTNEDRVN